MPYAIFDGLEPKEFFTWFGAVTEIPRPSGEEARLAAFLEQFAAERGLSCEKDTGGNVFMTVPASEGYENEPKVLFQAHMDIIPAKDPGVEFDFSTQPIRLRRDGDFIRGCGTNLGTDNGVGLATMLALADSKTIPHPPLELLFTTREEVGLQGVREFDMSKITARRMVNMDSGGSRTVAVCSCGKVGGIVEQELALEPLKGNEAGLLLRLSGGAGGHPGLQAGKERLCAVNALGELLSAMKDVSWHFVSAQSIGNAIFKGAEAILAVPRDAEESVCTRLEGAFAVLARIYKDSEPDIRLELSSAPLPERAVSEDASKRLAQVLRILRTGKYRTDPNDPGLVLTSAAFTLLRLEGSSLVFKWQTRSFSDDDQMAVFERMATVAEAFGFELKIADSYSGWKENPHSPFREKLLRVYRSLYGEEMLIERVQGGIEVGPIVGAIPDMDPIGMMPSCGGAHTTGEKLQLLKLPIYWKTMLALMAEKDEKRENLE